MSSQSTHTVATRTLSDVSRYAAIPLRAIAGGGFLQHGYAKVVKGPEAFAAILQSLHVPFPHLSVYLTISVELLGGAALLLGAFVALVSIPAIAVLLTAIFTVHLPYGFSSIKLKGSCGWSSAIRTAGIRMRPSLYWMYPGSRIPGTKPLVYRLLSFTWAQRLIFLSALPA
jgi:uncharacterized membrane protein YphA (DoxX/SURF4 family)